MIVLALITRALVLSILSELHHFNVLPADAKERTFLSILSELHLYTIERGDEIRFDLSILSELHLRVREWK